MLVTNHVLLGATVGIVLKKPLLAFPVGILSHLVLDSVPHWGRLMPETFMTVAVIDGLVGLTLMLTLWLRARPRRDALAGMMGAVLLDLDKPMRLVGVDLWPSFIDHVHWGVQTESVNLWWVEVMAFVVLGAAAFLLAQRSRMRAARGRAGAEVASESVEGAVGTSHEFSGEHDTSRPPASKRPRAE